MSLTNVAGRGMRVLLDQVGVDFTIARSPSIISPQRSTGIVQSTHSRVHEPLDGQSEKVARLASVNSDGSFDALLHYRSLRPRWS